MNNTQTNIMGKYAEQRRAVLENHAPEMYEAMAENGSLNAHLASVQDLAEQYVENYVERYKRSDEYLKAEKENPEEAMRLFNATVLEAEDTAYRIWIAELPTDDENEVNDDE